MKTKLLNKCSFLLAFLFVIQGCKKDIPMVSDTIVKNTIVSDTIVNGQRILQFSGYTWKVESSNDLTVGPGPNLFSDSKENVWFDANGELHLKITQRNNKWYCAKLTLLSSPGYGKYIFYLDSRIDKLDMNVVGGLFSYKSDLEEIDIEFSKWGLAGSNNAQFSVQPSLFTSNKKNYNIILSNLQSTHWFNWQKDRIDFASVQGHSSVLPSAGNIIQQWSYSGPNIPPLSVENTKINLWLYQGNPPSNLQEAEMVIAGFEFL
ncbi:MAG: hypothetical protein WCI31_12985 [Prolixibacteraceae bacterium]